MTGERHVVGYKRKKLGYNLLLLSFYVHLVCHKSDYWSIFGQTRRLIFIAPLVAFYIFMYWFYGLYCSPH
jgi:hypothetical protein